MSTEPFMEHPTGQFTNALDAISDAIERLSKYVKQDKWITFCGQGQGTQPDSYNMIDILVRGRSVDIGERHVDLKQVLSHASLDGTKLGVVNDNGIIELPLANTRQFAEFIDAIFYHLGVRPFEDEDDYAVGAEW